MAANPPAPAASHLGARLSEEARRIETSKAKKIKGTAKPMGQLEGMVAPASQPAGPAACQLSQVGRPEPR
jgi:hypothetical protein